MSTVSVSVNAKTTETETAKATKVAKPEKPARDKIDRKQATAALSSLTQAKRAIEGKAVTKKVQKREAVLAHREEEKKAALVLLDTGSTKKWSARFALVRAVTAMKMGASAEELRACKALMAVTDWSALEQPVRDYAVAVKADADQIASALCRKPLVIVASNPVTKVEPKVEPKAEPKAEPVKPPTPIRPSMTAVKPATVATATTATKVKPPAKPISRAS